jgi:hypothetical protein
MACARRKICRRVLEAKSQDIERLRFRPVRSWVVELARSVLCEVDLP